MAQTLQVQCNPKQKDQAVAFLRAQNFVVTLQEKDPRQGRVFVRVNSDVEAERLRGLITDDVTRKRDRLLLLR